jgi:stage III sporulation protein AB
MLVKIAGGLAVTAACALLGLYCAARETLRRDALLEIKKALSILASEIEYLRAPLPEACLAVAKRTAEPVSGFFHYFAETLSSGLNETVYRKWSQTLEERREALYLNEEDRQILDGFGKTLGYLDAQMQLNAIRQLTDYIEEKTAQLHEQNGKNQRMYRSLGFIGGMLAAVLLW